MSAEQQQAPHDEIVRLFKRYGGLTFAQNQDLKAGRYAVVLASLRNRLRVQWCVWVGLYAWIATGYRDDMTEFWSPTTIGFLLIGAAGVGYLVHRGRAFAELMKMSDVRPETIKG